MHTRLCPAAGAEITHQSLCHQPLMAASISALLGVTYGSDTRLMHWAHTKQRLNEFVYLPGSHSQAYWRIWKLTKLKVCKP